MQPLASSDKPTKEEVFRDFFVFWMNHQAEKLFLYDVFSPLVEQIYPDNARIDFSCNKGMTRLFRIMSDQPMSRFLTLLRCCRDVSFMQNMLGNTAQRDLHAVIDYAKEAC